MDLRIWVLWESSSHRQGESLSRLMSVWNIFPHCVIWLLYVHVDRWWPWWENALFCLFHWQNQSCGSWFRCLEMFFEDREQAQWRWVDTRGQQRTQVPVSYLDEVLPLLLACADRLLDAPQLGEDGLSLVELVVRLTAGHFPVDPGRRKHTWACRRVESDSTGIIEFSSLQTCVCVIVLL